MNIIYIFENWSDGDFEISKLKGNPRLESVTRIRKHTELLILCPDGENREFSFHCNYGFSDFRLHFVPFIPFRNRWKKKMHYWLY